MTGSNRWLVVLGVGLVVLVAMAVVLTLATGGQRIKTYAEDTPEGAVQRYLQALLDRDPDRAYTFLAPGIQADCPPSLWQEQSRFSFPPLQESQVTLKESRRTGPDEALVTVSISQIAAPGLFDVRPRESSYDQEFRLGRQPDGLWRFTQSPWPVFGCPVREPPAKPLPAPELAPAPVP